MHKASLGQRGASVTWCWQPWAVTSPLWACFLVWETGRKDSIPAHPLIPELFGGFTLAQSARLAQAQARVSTEACVRLLLPLGRLEGAACSGCRDPATANSNVVPACAGPLT